MAPFLFPSLDGGKAFTEGEAPSVTAGGGAERKRDGGMRAVWTRPSVYTYPKTTSCENLLGNPLVSVNTAYGSVRVYQGFGSASVTSVSDCVPPVWKVPRRRLV